jgi:para-aminobenzoate synthetase/4-amino-4-deoxychorismate lyase
MKGTAARACEGGEDEERAARLRLSEKERAENVMIVDMMRSDMGRIASPGSVRVPSLFELEKYPTVWQMTSTVVASTKASVSEIFGALYPSASVTGAPKIRTMRILSQLERSPRGVYTGAIGTFSPGRQASFRVAIRTAVVDRVRGEAEYGVGGGIVWDSTAGAEYDECLAKMRLLGARRPRFSLLETILWTPEVGFFLLDLHLDRLRASARYFDFPLDEAEVARRLRSVSDRPGASERRVRLLVGPDGEVSVEAAERTAAGGKLRVALAPRPIDPSDCFLYHKTTHRQAYDEARAAVPESEDVLLWNPRGEITESCAANVVVEVNGRPLTPPIASGLLGGTYRRHLLDRGEITEGVVTREELLASPRVWLINSVAGRREASLIGSPPGRTRPGGARSPSPAAGDPNERIKSPVSSRERRRA